MKIAIGCVVLAISVLIPLVGVAQDPVVIKSGEPEELQIDTTTIAPSGDEIVQERDAAAEGQAIPRSSAAIKVTAPVGAAQPRDKIPVGGAAAELQEGAQIRKSPESQHEKRAVTQDDSFFEKLKLFFRGEPRMPEVEQQRDEIPESDPAYTGHGGYPAEESTIGKGRFNTQSVVTNIQNAIAGSIEGMEGFASNFDFPEYDSIIRVDARRTDAVRLNCGDYRWGVSVEFNMMDLTAVEYMTLGQSEPQDAVVKIVDQDNDGAFYFAYEPLGPCEFAEDMDPSVRELFQQRYDLGHQLVIEYSDVLRRAIEAGNVVPVENSGVSAECFTRLGNAILPLQFARRYMVDDPETATVMQLEIMVSTGADGSCHVYSAGLQKMHGAIWVKFYNGSTYMPENINKLSLIGHKPSHGGAEMKMDRPQ